MFLAFLIFARVIFSKNGKDIFLFGVLPSKYSGSVAGFLRSGAAEGGFKGGIPPCPRVGDLTKKVLTLLAMFLLAVVFLASQRRLDSPPLVAQYIRTTALDGLSIVDPIRHALSRGIIQPQIYELVIG